MKVLKRQAKAIQSAIRAWESEGVVSPDDARKLRDNVEVIGFDWKRLARYSF